MPNVAGREFPYTPQGMAAADQYRQSLGMRHGGSMGFRPVGYQDGSLVEPRRNLGRLSGAGVAGAAEPVLDPDSRAAMIERIMFLTKMENPLVFLEMSDEQLRATLAKVEKDALAREMQQMQQIPPPPPMLKMPPRLRPPESLLPSPRHQQQQGPLMQPQQIPPPPQQIPPPLPQIPPPLPPGIDTMSIRRR